MDKRAWYVDFAVRVICKLQTYPSVAEIGPVFRAGFFQGQFRRCSKGNG
jgi:hypothetical protein